MIILIRIQVRSFKAMALSSKDSSYLQAPARQLAENASHLMGGYAPHLKDKGRGETGATKNEGYFYRQAKHTSGRPKFHNYISKTPGSSQKRRLGNVKPLVEPITK